MFSCGQMCILKVVKNKSKNFFFLSYSEAHQRFRLLQLWLISENKSSNHPIRHQLSPISEYNFPPDTVSVVKVHH